MSKSVVHFTIRFGIPWIWKWDFACDYQNKVPRLKRIFFVKWWDKGMNPTLTETVQKIQQHTKACWETVKQPALPSPTPVLSSNPFLEIQKELKQKYPDLSEHQLIIKSMDFLKEQFLQTVSQDDDVSMTSGTSQSLSEATGDAEHILSGESQNPEDDTNLGDFWDSLTAVIADKITRDKDRKGKGHAP